MILYRMCLLPLSTQDMTTTWQMALSCLTLTVLAKMWVLYINRLPCFRKYILTVIFLVFLLSFYHTAPFFLFTIQSIQCQYWQKNQCGKKESSIRFQKWIFHIFISIYWKYIWLHSLWKIGTFASHNSVLYFPFPPCPHLLPSSESLTCKSL